MYRFNAILAPTLIVFLFTVLISSTYVPNNTTVTTLSLTDMEALARINTVKIPIRLGIYQLWQETLTSEIKILNETTAMDDLTCETSLASPWVWDIRHAADSIRNMNWCIQKNLFGSGCTTHARSGTAALGACGTFWLAVRCKDLSWVGDLVIANCRWRDQAGGKYEYNGPWGLLTGVVF
ncbi:hypothetical protein L873DRAFT_103896 [Choiromyces venosus 120613-1]|uniref:Uncharacterized protein n=1 Tax=Choiromyces venosus 120613-1 TaxID=1336337 RepID=A0A3N4K2W3_9PEZI|nr:hypothetical protein L873DRAFT_103896 [Choiromyces venosus 120613-1]